MVEMRIVNGKWRRVRGGRLISLGKKPTLTAKAKHLSDRTRAKANALEKYPELNAWLDVCAEQARQVGSGGRFDHYAVLEGIYEKIIEWDGDDVLDERASTIAQMQGKARRKNQSPVNVLVGAICERARRNRQLVSRWSGHLNKAWDEGVNPKELKQFLREHPHSAVIRSQAY